MNKNQFRIVLIILGLLLNSSAKVVAGEANVSITVSKPSNSSRLIEVNSGEEFNIPLESNKTTGYGWELAKPLDKDFLIFIDTKYISDYSGLPGRGGNEVWLFKALKAGKTTIYFKYVRPWEIDKPPVNEQTFEIVINEKESSKVNVGGDIVVTSVNRKGVLWGKGNER